MSKNENPQQKTKNNSIPENKNSLLNDVNLLMGVLKYYQDQNKDNHDNKENFRDYGKMINSLDSSKIKNPEAISQAIDDVVRQCGFAFHKSSFIQSEEEKENDDNSQGKEKEPKYITEYHSSNPPQKGIHLLDNGIVFTGIQSRKEFKEMYESLFTKDQLEENPLLRKAIEEFEKIIQIHAEGKSNVYIGIFIEQELILGLDKDNQKTPRECGKDEWQGIMSLCKSPTTSPKDCTAQKVVTNQNLTQVL